MKRLRNNYVMKYLHNAELLFIGRSTVLRWNLLE